MHTISARLTLFIPCAASLKDKRRVRHSIIDKTRKRFNASIAEVDTHDIHQTLTIGIAVVSGSATHAKRSLNEIIRYVENGTEAELYTVEIM
jgi:uncharacterized protein YlxP (DUF503 family)